MDILSKIASLQLDKKVLLFVSAGFGVVILLILLTFLTISLTSKNSTPRTVNSGNSVSNNSGIAKQSSFPTQALNPTVGWKNYQNTQYSFLYPPDWQVQEENFSPTEPGVNIKPMSSSASSNITIFSESGSAAATLKQNELTLVNSGFKMDFIFVDNLQATRLLGTTPPIRANFVNQSVTYKTYLILYYNGSSYFFEYKYIGIAPNRDPQLESIFNNILASFKLLR